MREYLYQKLKTYGEGDCYPFHMPGHKRQDFGMGDFSKIDITEIDGFDNLHHAEGILKEAQDRTAKLVGSKKSYFLVNGSTCGILAAISTVFHPGDKILMARNCHKAAYHGVFLRQLKVKFLYPKITSFGIQGQIRWQDVEQALKEDPDIRGIFLTSPTYDGIVSDIGKISELAREAEIPLIVDEAHGAHFGFHSFFPKSANQCGADLVIQSWHKTLPAFTQTAILNVNTDRISLKKVEQYLDIYETSSPSYILMAGLDACNRLLEEKGKELFHEYKVRLEVFYKKMESLKHLKLVTKSNLTEDEAFDFDMGKIIISCKYASLSGLDLYKKLLEEYHLQMEMCSDTYVTAITSIMDTEDGMRRLEEALFFLDQQLEEKMDERDAFVSVCYEQQKMEKRSMEIYQAMELPQTELLLEESVGHISGEYIYLYPPGIPLLVPGEIISQKMVLNLKKIQGLGLELQGLSDYEGKRINVVNSRNIYYT